MEKQAGEQKVRCVTWHIIASDWKRRMHSKHACLATFGAGVGKGTAVECEGLLAVVSEVEGASALRQEPTASLNEDAFAASSYVPHSEPMPGLQHCRGHSVRCQMVGRFVTVAVSPVLASSEVSPNIIIARAAQQYSAVASSYGDHTQPSNFSKYPPYHRDT